MPNDERADIVVDILKNRKVVPGGILEKALQDHCSSSDGAASFESFLIAEKIIDEEALLDAFSSYFGMPRIDLQTAPIDPGSVRALPAGFSRENLVFPVSSEDGVLAIALCDPLNARAIDEARIISGMEIRPVLALQSQVETAIKEHYGVGAETVESLLQTHKEPLIEAAGAGREPEVLDQADDEASIIKYVNQLIEEAVSLRATDIHVEPLQQRLRVRYRIDGILQETTVPSTAKTLHPAIVSRLKLMARMNIAETRRPQDGAIMMTLAGVDLDLRLATSPTLHGESVSIRILRKEGPAQDLPSLGLAGRSLDDVQTLVGSPHGLLLVVGPTGCGKTTTLYTIVSKLNSNEVRIITVEDPIEYHLDGVNQIQINPAIGLTFAGGLRSILRQDPDIMMVGEIRDLETSDMAVHAALTGHLVMSTLHTNDAPGTLVRLLDMGIEPYLVTSAVTGVIAQRLVRVVCPECRELYRPEATYLAASGLKVPDEGIPEISRAVGCQKCRNTGYHGRTAIFEVLLMSDTLRELVLQKAPSNVLADAARRHGMATLREDGWKKVVDGITTVEEIIRATGAHDSRSAGDSS